MDGIREIRIWVDQLWKLDFGESVVVYFFGLFSAAQSQTSALLYWHPRSLMLINTHSYMVIVLVSAKRRLHEISRDNGDDAENTEDEADGAKYPTVLVKCCGRLPLDCDPTAFLGRPANIDKTR